VSWTQVWAASFGTKLRLDVNAFFEENALKQRVLVTEHQTLVCRVPMGGLEIGQVLLMGTDGLFELLDVLGSPFPESCLCLAVSLFPLL